MAVWSQGIQPNTHVFLRLPSDLLKAVEVKPDTIIDIGKFGSFPSNLILGRPFYHTYEVLEKRNDEPFCRLRIVSPLELNAEAIVDDATTAESRDNPTETTVDGTPEGFDLIGDDGQVIIKNNRLTIDDTSRQTLSHEEIEELKRSSGGKEIVEKILASHTALDEKNAFSKAKYTLRKTKKYLKRFTVLPMELGYLIDYVLEKEPGRIMDMREESLGLVCSWSNAHFTEDAKTDGQDDHEASQGRLLVIDDTGGLLVAAHAERMGILRSRAAEASDVTQNGVASSTEQNGNHTEHENGNPPANGATEVRKQDSAKHTGHRDFPTPARSNSITLVHSAVQPNISLLKYFGYDANQPDTEHPLHTHLKPLSWLQFLHPDEDPMYREPERVEDPTIQSWKSGKRGNYFKKRRRWERCRTIVDEARAGEFDSLVIASHMDPESILRHTVPLVKGGGNVVIYSPTIEPLVQVMDLYSKDRRIAYLGQLAEDPDMVPDEDDFPVDPRLLLAPTLQTSRIREWQVLPGRTHPLMSSRGGSEGYVFTARRVIPLEGVIEAKGMHGKRRKLDANTS